MRFLTPSVRGVIPGDVLSVSYVAVKTMHNSSSGQACSCVNQLHRVHPNQCVVLHHRILCTCTCMQYLPSQEWYQLPSLAYPYPRAVWESSQLPGHFVPIAPHTGCGKGRCQPQDLHFMPFITKC